MSTNPNEVRYAIERFIALIENSSGPAGEALLRLVDVLDELARLGRDTEPSWEEGHADPPRASPERYQRARELADGRFPDLGLYNLPDPISRTPGDAQIMVADPYDDIADIAGDLFQVQWCFANTSDRDALWHFRLGYVSHWGHHVSNLRWYLYSRILDR